MLGLRSPRARLSKQAFPTSSTNRLKAFPRIMVWAWERPEELDWLDPRQEGVAFLASTLRLREAQVIVRPRLQPLKVARGTVLMAVARIESDAAVPPELSIAQRLTLATAIADLAALSGVSGVQVDFDATVSERHFYRALISDLRRRLPPSMPLSITALSSWCFDDNWLDGLPVDEAVPMLFRMGADRREVLARLKAGEDFQAEACRQSMGISTDEPIEQLPRGRRIYVFHPRAWVEDAMPAVVAEVSRWH